MSRETLSQTLHSPACPGGGHPSGSVLTLHMAAALPAHVRNSLGRDRKDLNVPGINHRQRLPSPAPVPDPGQDFTSQPPVPAHGARPFALSTSEEADIRNSPRGTRELFYRPQPQQDLSTCQELLWEPAHTEPGQGPACCCPSDTQIVS